MNTVLEFKAEKQDGRKTVILTENGRTCLKCNKEKSWDEFAKDVHGFNQKTATCKSCRKIKHKHAYDSNPAVRRSGIKNRPDKLMRLYGVTYEQVVRTLDAQHGLCANRGCGRKISLEVKGNTPDRAVIDHNHETGKFRAMLCVPCNSILGTLETKENIVQGLYDYINKYN